MNTQQVLRQIRYLLRQETWTTEPVFADGSVILTLGADDAAIARRSSPVAIIAPGTARADPEEPDLLTQDFIVRLIVANHADGLGENALIGANRVGQQDSRGRGLLEIEERVHDALTVSPRQNGLVIHLKGSQANAATLRDGTYWVSRDLTFTAKCTTDRFYHEPIAFAVVDATGGDATVSWTIPPGRFDWREIVVRRAAGATPPASATDGTGVTLTDATTSGSDTDSPGAGTYSYAAFAAYDEYSTSANERFSDAKTATSVVVT